MSRHAAITIISKNYFAFAKTLAESFKQHHPTHDFIIVLVDRADGMVPERLECGAEVVEIAAFEVPDLERMIYRYSIMEFNTAVKPFVMADLFRRLEYDTLLYIDPDIRIFEPLSAIYDGLQRASIVLTPHMRRPFFDDAQPSDTAILQSGTYNLGFLGLRRGDTATRMLEWWMGKLYRDCIVDIPNGLFVDQKWIDLVPGFFPDHAIIHHPGYNAAYWNLHERPITRDGWRWMADGQPLVFFHFSGYVPYAPDTLSKHQNRHVLAEMPVLKALTDAYGAELVANGYETSCRWPYAFATLSNGVRLPLDLVAPAMQWASRHGVRVPCPISEANRFCAFLMSRDRLPGRPHAVLLFEFLLRLRADVSAAFPGCRDDHRHAGFRGWIKSSGVTEYKLADLLPFEGMGDEPDLVAELIGHLASGSAPPDATGPWWADDDAFDAVIAWCERGQDIPGGPSRRHADALRAAMGGVHRILHLYYRRVDLQREFPELGGEEGREAFCRWLIEHRYELRLEASDVTAFREFARHSSAWLARAGFLYRHTQRGRVSEPGLYTLESRRHEIGSPQSAAELQSWLLREPAIEPIDHFVQQFGQRFDALEDFGKVSVAGLEAKQNFDFVRRLRAQAEARESSGQVAINLAGFFDAPTGMGESARSLAATLQALSSPVRQVGLPHPQTLRTRPLGSPALFGWPAAGARVSIAVANADTTSFLESFLPRGFWGERSVGYWVWETEQLPARHALAQESFDEIWTPSEYSARAIRAVVDRPVHVLPHTIDFEAAERAQADRNRFGLPTQGLVLGFAFDPQSVLERKNVLGLIRAFNEAFRDDDDCYLVLKVNSTGEGDHAYHDVLARARSERILVLERVLDRDGTFAFLKSLDAYVSLHRSEGFGLTCAESMAAGVPVVASGYSGNLDFMGPDSSLLVPTRVIETERPFGPYPAGTRWGEPDHDAAVDALRQLRSASRRQALSEAGRAHVRQCLDPSVLAKRLGFLLKGATAAQAT